jgi:hypothetical protein
MKYYFCNLLERRILELEQSCSPIVKMEFERVRQSYNKQQHTIRSEAWVKPIFIPIGHELRNHFFNLLRERFHTLIQFKLESLRVVHNFYPPIVAREENWGVASIDDYTEGFSRKNRELIKSHYITDRIKKPDGKGYN